VECLKIVAAQAFKPVIGAADLSVTQLENLAERAGLPGSIIENCAGSVPLHATESFLNSLHNKLGDPDYLFKSLKIDANEKRETHSVVGVPLPTGETGIEALQTLTSTFNNYITGAQFYCETKGDLLWVERTTSATDWSNTWPVMQYNLSIILLGVCRTLGQGMRPIALKLPLMQTDGNLPDTLRDIPITLNRYRFGMGFKLHDIVTTGFTLKNDKSSLNEAGATVLAENLHEAFASCLSMFLTAPTTDNLSDRVGKSFGFSPRTYRRHMKNLGTSHAKVLSDVRLDLALKLLEDDCVSVETVSIELGYAHPGDFTRFFKRRMGCCPTEYRLRKFG